MGGVHKARVHGPDSDDLVVSVCAVCNGWIKKVHGGQGPTWVHADTGAVAGPGGDPDVPGTHAFLVIIDGCTEGQARTVMEDRMEARVDEDYVFDYDIRWR